MIILGIFNKKRKESEKDPKNSLVDKWPDHVISLDENNFEDFIQKYPLSLVDFWAPWCGPCKMMAPRMRRLATIYKKKVAFGKLDTQKNQDIAKQYKIMGIPHFAFFRYGKKIASMTGVKSVGNIKDTIDDLLKKM